MTIYIDTLWKLRMATGGSIEFRSIRSLWWVFVFVYIKFIQIYFQFIPRCELLCYQLMATDGSIILENNKVLDTQTRRPLDI